MKILHLNAGNETGGGMNHILSLLRSFDREQFILGVFEKGELWEQARNAGIQTVYFPYQTKISFTLIREIADYMNHHQVTYVHTHGPRANVYARMLKRIASFHWIVTVHSHPKHDFSGKGIYGTLSARMNMQAIKKADKVIVVSESLQNELKKIGVCPHKMTITCNGIDFDQKMAPPYQKSDFGITDDQFLFLIVARLESVKGHDIALRAFAQHLQTDIHCQLMLIGDGGLLKELKHMAHQLGIVDHVHFLGHRGDVERFYQMADITLLTSWSEGFPLVLLESARTKTPIIATDVGSVGQLIMNDLTGWKIKPGHIKGIACAMQEAVQLKRKGGLSVLGENLYTHAAAQFSLKTFTENIYNVYLGIEDIN